MSVGVELARFVIGVRPAEGLFNLRNDASTISVDLGERLLNVHVHVSGWIAAESIQVASVSDAVRLRTEGLLVFVVVNPKEVRPSARTE